MVEDDERRSHSRTGLVLNDELVMLEHPVEVALLLHLVECVAAWRVEGTKQQAIRSYSGSIGCCCFYLFYFYFFIHAFVLG